MEPTPPDFRHEESQADSKGQSTGSGLLALVGLAGVVALGIFSPVLLLLLGSAAFFAIFLVWRTTEVVDELSEDRVPFNGYIAHLFHEYLWGAITGLLRR